MPPSKIMWGNVGHYLTKLSEHAESMGRSSVNDIDVMALFGVCPKSARDLLHLIAVQYNLTYYNSTLFLNQGVSLEEAKKHLMSNPNAKIAIEQGILCKGDDGILRRKLEFHVSSQV